MKGKAMERIFTSKLRIHEVHNMIKGLSTKAVSDIWCLKYNSFCLTTRLSSDLAGQRRTLSFLDVLVQYNDL